MRASILTTLFFLSLISKTTIAQVTAEQDTSSNIIETVMDMLSINKEKYSVTFFPTMTYNQEEGLSLGAFAAIIINSKKPILKSKYYRPTTIVPSVSYSTKNFMLIENDLLAYTKRNLFIGSKLLIYRMPVLYYGTGTPSSNPLMLNQRAYTVAGSFLKSLNDLYFVGISYDLGYISNTYDNNKEFNSIYGIKGGAHIGVGIQARLDTRDDILYPSKGVLIDISSMQYFINYNFNISEIDVRYFKSIFSQNNIIALQTLFTIGNGEIPFYKLPKLGGQNMLRSIDNSNKYINNVVYLSQVEYRRWIWERFGAVAFVGVGNSLDKITGAYFKDIIYMYGLGVRFRLLEEDKLNFRFDASLGNGSTAIFMTIREAF